MKDTDIRILELEPSFTDEQLRTPLKFGTGVVEAVTALTVRAKVETRGGALAEGWGHILLSDVWGFPSAVLSHEQRDEAMRLVGERFCAFIADRAEFGHPVDLFLQAKPDLIRIAGEVGEELQLEEPMPVLGALVCGSPADAALHDAFGMANGVCTYEAYGPEFMEHDLSAHLGEEFSGRHIADYVEQGYAPTLAIFHLVGGMDKLVAGEITADDPDDGLPVSLDQWIERDGLICFKVKLTGTDIAWDVARTAAVAEVIRETKERLGQAAEFWLSTDSNEMNESPDSVVEYLERLREASPLAYDALLYVEQPTERELGAHRFDMRAVAALKPVVADEGVTDVEKLRLAIELGWSGVGLKTCKGHSSALLYVALMREKGLIYTVQDLTNPGLSLIHSVGLAARISPLRGVEYNSRQYLPWSCPEVRALHMTLFTVRDGMIHTGSMAGRGLGY